MPAPTKPKRIILTEGTPALVTNLPDIALKEDQSPSVTSISTTAEGFLQTGTLPAAVTTVVKQYTISTVVYDWHYNRLWRIDNTGTTPKLIYGAPEYIATYYRQGTGEVEFRESTTNILKIIPFGGGSIAVFKSDGGYIVRGADSQAGGFESGAFIQEMNISTATHAIEIDEICYFINSTGLFTVSPDGTITEISFPVRGTASISAAALTASYNKKILRIGTVMGYDVNTKRFYDYKSAFSYTSRRLAGENSEPFSVQRVDFEYELTDDQLGEIKFETQTENRGWSRTNTVAVRASDRDGNQATTLTINKVDTGMSFILRISSLSSNIKIKRIIIPAEGYTPGSRRS